MKKEVMVINYHNITDRLETAVDPLSALFSVTPAVFKAQVKILIKHQIPVITVDAILTDAIEPGLSVIITADDGNRSDYEIMYPVLKENKMSATFFWLACEKHKDINRDEALEMIGHGFSIGSHGITHRELTQLKAEEQMMELEVSKKNLEELTGETINYFAFPFGTYTSNLLELVKKAGYTAAFTTDMKLNNAEEHPVLIHRWNIKRNLSLKEFENTLTKKSVLNYRLKTARVKNTAKRLLGKGFADKLNLFINS